MLADTTRPIYRTTYQDGATGREFVAKRVAVQYARKCSDRTAASDVPRRDLSDCRGPISQQVVEGTLDGRTIYAVFTLIEGSPCCYCRSYPTLKAGWTAHALALSGRGSQASPVEPV